MKPMQKCQKRMFPACSVAGSKSESIYIDSHVQVPNFTAQMNMFTCRPCRYVEFVCNAKNDHVQELEFKQFNEFLILGILDSVLIWNQFSGNPTVLISPKVPFSLSHGENVIRCRLFGPCRMVVCFPQQPFFSDIVGPTRTHIGTPHRQDD